MEPSLLDAIFSEEIFLIPAKVTVVIDRPWKLVSSEEKILLEKILGALKLSVDKVSVLNVALTDLELPSDKVEKIISFGVPFSGAPHYEVSSLGPIPMVISDSLDKLLTNDESKKMLWQALKRLFSGS